MVGRPQRTTTTTKNLGRRDDDADGTTSRAGATARGARPRVGPSAAAMTERERPEPASARALEGAVDPPGARDDAGHLLVATPARRPAGGGAGDIVAALRDPSSGRQLALLLLFTALHNFKPSEPFLVEFWRSRGVSTREAVARVLPVFAYARLPALALVVLAARVVGCKPAVVFGATCACATVGATLAVPAAAPLLASQALAAVSFAAHQAATGLAFATLPRERFPAAAHALKAVTMASNCVSALVGQLARETDAPLVALFLVSLVAQALSVLPAVALAPDVRVERPPDEDDEDDEREDGRVGTLSLLGTLSLGTLGTSILVDPTFVLWCAWSVACAPAHASAASAWQALARLAGADGDAARERNGYFLAVKYGAAGYISVRVGGMAYRDARHERCGGGRGEAAALTLSPAAMAAAAAAAALGSRAVVYPALAVFDCTFEATSCVCAAKIAAHARDAADRASVRTGSGRARTRSSSPSRARVNDDEDDEDDEAYATAPLLDRRASIASRDTGPRHVSFGSSATALFACLSAAGYLVGTAGQAAADGARLSAEERMLSVAAELLLAAVALGAGWTATRGRRGVGEGEEEAGRSRGNRR